MRVTTFLPVLPLLAIASPDVPPEQETWAVSTLDMHMMTADSGLPGGEWPDAYRFNTTINIEMTLHHEMVVEGDIGVYVDATAICDGEWANGTLPTDVGWACVLTFTSNYPLSDEQVNGELGMVGFWLEAQDLESELAPANIAGVSVVRQELSYKLNIIRDGKKGDGGYYIGTIDVSANDPDSSSGFLTCLNGAPLEGLICKKGANDGIDLSNGLDMSIVAESEDPSDDEEMTKMVWVM